MGYCEEGWLVMKGVLLLVLIGVVCLRVMEERRENEVAEKEVMKKPFAELD